MMSVKKVDDSLLDISYELDILKKMCAEKDNEILFLKRQIKFCDELIDSSLDYCSMILETRSYKVMQLLFKFVRQGLLGNISEKRYFYGLCKNFLFKRNGNAFSGSDMYNYVEKIADKLNVLSTYNTILEKNKENIYPSTINGRLADCLQAQYKKTDIIILSVINYDFRFQRPQHIAKNYAEDGHRVFFVNPTFFNYRKISEREANLYIVDYHSDDYNNIYDITDNDKFSEWSQKSLDELIAAYAICDALVIVDYPNWFVTARYLKYSYGFNIIFDYMDDNTGFLHTVSALLKNNTENILFNSDMVISSSLFLKELSDKYNHNNVLIRNGTEFRHFYRARMLAKGKKHKDRKIIGYYGAISHWFDWEKICFLAEKIPECDVILIGEVLEYEKNFCKWTNIKLLGEKKYHDLPKYLADFDVCLIPFDASINLIKATNPVKFYEYLSAGKKIVATEIPELLAYKDKYLYMTNETEKFCEYVRLCLDSKDKLASADECTSFAQKNDWQYRYISFKQACLINVPKVSIIVLTYNNLSLNKICIDSILNKTAYPNYEIIIVDNLSSDGTIEYLRDLNARNISNLKIIFNKSNLGFAAGNNIGIMAAEGKYLVLLNNDTVVTRGWITNMVKHMERDDLCGMVGAVTNSIGNEAMIAVNYKNLEELDKFAYIYTMFNRNKVYSGVDRLALFCTMIRKDIVDKYGGLDDTYEVGMFEDDDYSLLVKQSGYRFYVVEDVFVHHVNNASFNKLHPEEYRKIFEENKSRYENKWHVKWTMPRYRVGVSAEVNDNMMKVPVMDETM